MRANVFTYLDGRSRNESRLSNKNYLALPRNRKDSRLKNSIIINESHPFRETVTKLQNHRLIIAQSPAAPALLYPDDFTATNVYMQTDLNADLRLFEFVLLGWRLMMHSLSSFDNTVFSLKTGAFSNCFLQNNCSKNQILTQNFHSSRKAEHSRFPVL